ncbi:MAG TPA: response regulator transcription factor, partial [Gaiellaceae bacterium]
MIDLLICDDSDEARAAIRTMLADHDEIALVGEAVDGDQAVALALALAPDVVLMDLRMPVVDGIEATRRISRLLPETRVVAFSGVDDAASISAVMEAGAASYCVKGAPLWELERAIAGRSEPLVRLAHGLAKATDRAGIGTIVARELVELTGASVAATYFASPDVALSL